MKKLLALIIIFSFSIPVFAQNKVENNGNIHDKRLYEKLKKRGLSDQEIQVEIKNHRESKNEQLKKNEIGFFEKQTTSRSTTSCADIPLSEKQALEIIYDALDGDSWQNQWDFDTPVTSWNPSDGTGWYGIHVDENCRVERIDLPNNGLHGDLPNFNAFPNLRILDLSFNNISGSISSNLNNLSQLKGLYLSGNDLSGDFSNIGLLHNLSFLYLGENNFNNPSEPNYNNHSIPSSFANLTNLIILDLSDCGLSQNLSLVGQYFVSLSWLYLSNNNFAGPLPSNFSNLQSLTIIDFDDNLITDISALSNLTNLSKIWFRNNDLTFIPSGFSNFTEIMALYLTNNNLTGSIPPSFFSNYTHLKELDLHNNYLQGDFPDLSSISQLTILRISNNKFRFINFVNQFTHYSTFNLSGFINNFTYSPQEKTDTLQSITVNNGDTVTLTMCEDDEFHPDDTFQWYKGTYPDISNPVTIESTSQKSFTFIAHQASTASYFCLSRHHQPTMTNNSTYYATNLTLVRNQITLTVLGEDPPCYNCTSFDLVKSTASTQSKYLVSGWVKEEDPSNFNRQFLNYEKSCINVSFININGSIIGTLYKFYPSGEIIDGWQRIVGEFVVPSNVDDMSIELVNENTDTKVSYFDDIRVLPSKGNMKSFVYDQKTQRLMAELDENNYSTFYEYDLEGGLIRIKKETEKGVFTIQETRSGNIKKYSNE